jgi:hypothetical protein
MTLDRDVQRLALHLYRQLDSPRALTCFMLVEAGEWDQLVSLRVDPRNYEPLYHRGVDLYRRDIQATEFLRKADFLPTTIDREAVAVEGFWASEKVCCETNARLDRYCSFPVLETDLQEAAWGVIQRAKRWIAKVLGDLPDVLDGRFGPGATFESARWRHRRKMTAYDKLRNIPTATSGAAELADHLVWQTALSSAWGRCVPHRLFPIVRGNRFTTVPKDATKDRGICIEPGLNVWAQLAVGGAMKHRLKRIGLNLSADTTRHDRFFQVSDTDYRGWIGPRRKAWHGFSPRDKWHSHFPTEVGKPLHRRLACEASLSGRYATIDLSNASDTVAINLVKLLLPEEWYDLLDDLRSKFTQVEVVDDKGKQKVWVKLNKFSSMGNGFTFELETLIFAGLLHAVGCKIGADTFVYGDDMIVPSHLAREALAVLRYFGFEPNAKKTFSEGVFRESCGGDYFLGHDVRPYYLKEFPDEPDKWIAVANGLWRVSRNWGFPQLMAARNRALDSLPSDIRRCRGPSCLGDLVVNDDDPASWLTVVRESRRYFRVWRPVQRKLHLRSTENHLTLVAAVLGLPIDGLAPRGWGVKGHRFGRLCFS